MAKLVNLLFNFHFCELRENNHQILTSTYPCWPIVARETYPLNEFLSIESNREPVVHTFGLSLRLLRSLGLVKSVLFGCFGYDALVGRED